jgi:hypothetical protein
MTGLSNKQLNHKYTIYINDFVLVHSNLIPPSPLYMRSRWPPSCMPTFHIPLHMSSRDIRCFALNALSANKSSTRLAFPHSDPAKAQTDTCDQPPPPRSPIPTCPPIVSRLSTSNTRQRQSDTSKDQHSSKPLNPNTPPAWR